MSLDVLAPFIEQLPPGDIPIDGVWSRLLQGIDHQVVFFRLPKGLEIPPHSHCAQWGVVISGNIEITISGESVVYSAGESYYVPVDAIHEALCLTEVVALDVFDVPKRYNALHT
jgi:quercetin dioxygenase-like cupin family protein